MLTVRELLPPTPRIGAVTPDTSVAEAALLMTTQGFERLLVLEGGALRGLLTRQDCAQVAGACSPGRSALQLPVRAVMRRDVRPVRPDEPLAACAEQMAATHTHHLAVLDAEQPLGILSLHEVTAALLKRLAEQEFLVIQLEHYITGRRA